MIPVLRGWGWQVNSNAAVWDGKDRRNWLVGAIGYGLGRLCGESGSGVELGEG